MQTIKHTATDPELVRQMGAAGDSSRSIQAIFSLDLPLRLQMPEPAKIERATYRVLQEVVDALGYKPGAVSIFRNLGSFAVFADAAFIRRVINHPDIASAIAQSRGPRAAV